MFAHFLLSLLLMVALPEKSGVGETNSREKMDVSSLYLRLGLAESGLSREAFDSAVAGWEKLDQNNQLARPEILAVADFSLSANQKRLFILNLREGTLLRQTYVAHGRNTGDEFARTFSNESGSYCSSPGFYLTGEPYSGRHGLSLKLNGLQPGINDQALHRAIVIHGADYVSADFIKANGRLGRSLGCPAVPQNEAPEIIQTLQNGTCLYIHVQGTPAL